MRAYKVIQKVLVFLGGFLVLGMGLILGNNLWREREVDLASRQYMGKTYDFGYSIETIQYDFVMDICRVDIQPESSCKEPAFTLHLNDSGGRWHVVADSFLQEKTAEWLYQEWTDTLKSFWGKDIQLGISLDSPELCKLPLEGQNEYSPQDVWNVTFDRQILVLSLPETSMTELPTVTVLETIQTIQKTVPRWKCLMIVFPDSTATAENSTSAACPGLIFEPLSDFQTEKDVTSNKVLYQNVALQNFPLR